MIPEGKHDDWRYKPDIPIIGPILGILTWPLSQIPRHWTAFDSDIPPVKILGTAEGHLDIPSRGTWALAGVGDIPIPVYFAITAENGTHFHIGLFRYDYNGHYYQIPSLTFKRRHAGDS